MAENEPNGRQWAGEMLSMGQGLIPVLEEEVGGSAPPTS